MKKFIRVLVPLLLAVLIIASIGWYLFTYDRGFTRDFLLTQARYNDLHGNSRLSSWFYDLAYNFSNHDENVAIELANLYKADDNYTKAEYTLTNAINSEPSAELFTALCKTYVEQDKLLDAVSLLDKITNPDIKAEIEAQRPDAPISNYEPGYYSQYIDVTLYAAGKLYYTTNGEYPSVKDPVYESPITLPAGETTIYAIAVGDNGLVSPLTVLGYTVTGVIEEVKFADPAMEAALRELTGTRDGDSVYTSQLWQITEFTVPEDTKVYTDLTFMPYLEKLTIANQDIDSLESLSSLTKLTSLDLRQPVQPGRSDRHCGTSRPDRAEHGRMRPEHHRKAVRRKEPYLSESGREHHPESGRTVLHDHADRAESPAQRRDQSRRIGRSEQSANAGRFLQRPDYPRPRFQLRPTDDAGS